MRLVAALAAAVALAGVPAGAATLTIKSITGTWSNAKADGNGTSLISWGKPWKDRKLNPTREPSAWGFASPSTPFNAVDNTFVGLGTFTHYNRTIFTGSKFRGAELSVKIGIDGYASPITSVFRFTHEETPNNGRCPYGGANGKGVNVNGCADRVVAKLNLAKSDSFVIGGDTYVFDVSGFEVGGRVLESFLTIERKTNVADLVGIFRVLGPNEAPPDPPIEPIPNENPGPPPDPAPPPGVVPLPAAGWMLLAAVAGLPLLRRIRRRA